MSPRAASALLAGQNRVLGLLATGAPLGQVFDALLEALEEGLPGARCAVLVADPAAGVLRHLAAPSLPPAYADACAAIPIGPRVGSCGTAAWQRERVVVPDVRTSPAFAEWLGLTEALGIRSSWSLPLFAAGGGDVLGTLAVYRGRPGIPTRDDLRLIDDAAFLAALAIERHRDERALRESEEKFRRLVEHASDVIASLDGGGRLTFVSPNVRRILGWTPDALVGAPARDVVHPGDLGAAEEAVRAAVRGAGGVPAVELRLRREDGEWRWMNATLSPSQDARGRVAGVVVVGRDIDEHKRMQAQLVLADRLATMGTLAAGVAHEINNPLYYVLANLRFAVSRLGALDAQGAPAVGDLRGALADAVDGAQRVQAIVADLRALSRAEVDGPRSADVEQVVQASTRMLGKQLRHRARVALDLGGLPRVVGDDGRLAQVFLNLLTNAMHALPPATPERNVIEIRGRYEQGGVVIEVADNGAGMDAATRERAFDPFFTTKPQGEGTGLGLPIVHGIVGSLGGRLDLRSDPGSGTVVRLWLPESPRSSSGDARALAPAPHGGCRRRLLVVDDEAAIGRALLRTLRGRHEVDFVTDGASALARLDAGERYDAALFDLMMPGMSGIELHDRVCREHPALAPRVGFMTGGAFTPEAMRFLDGVAGRVIGKPFDVDAVLELVADLVDGVDAP